ncbi:MAG: tetratricopeptide repeat protein [Candidatus Sericytochromatia bacterium]|nr:tetratricopeptide repeat protein [Candidatus Sericytochromatia bacterium]
MAKGRKALKYGRAQDATTCFEKALMAQPQRADLWSLRAESLMALGQPDAAVQSLCRALVLAPGDAKGHNNLGVILVSQGKFDEAVASFRRAVRLDPDYLVALNNLGQALDEQNRRHTGEPTDQAAEVQAPSDAVAAFQQATALYSLKRYNEAIVQLELATSLDPSYIDAWTNLGLAWAECNQPEKAIPCFERSLALRENAGIRLAMATVLPIMPDSTEAIAFWRARYMAELQQLQATGVRLADPVGEVLTASFYLAYHGAADRPFQEALAAYFRSACARLSWVAPHCHRSMPLASQGGKIRIGIVSAHLWPGHTIGKLNGGFLQHLDRSRFTVSYVCTGRQTAEAVSMAGQADDALWLAGDLTTMQGQVAERQFDVLFYTDIGMDVITYFLAFARLAPVQCVTWGHPVTTGLPNMDYFLSSAALETPDAQRHYTERLVLLHGLPTCYQQPDGEAVEVDRNRFGFAPDWHVYACPQSLFKFHPGADSLWAAILRSDPAGRFVVIESDESAVTQALQQRWLAAFPDVYERVVFLPRQSGPAFRVLLASVDVLLDTPYFGGGNTSLEATSLGTPIVTCPGPLMKTRVTQAIYQRMGSTETVAATSEEYVALAIRLGTDADWRTQVSQRLIADRHLLFGDLAVVRELERFFGAAVDAAREDRQVTDWQDGWRPTLSDAPTHPAAMNEV